MAVGQNCDQVPVVLGCGVVGVGVGSVVLSCGIVVWGWVCIKTCARYVLSLYGSIISVY